MSMPSDLRDLRQSACRKRARRARRTARLLVPLLFMATGSAVWTDPALTPKFAGGLEALRPVAAPYLAGTPFAGLIAGAEMAQAGASLEADPSEKANPSDPDPAPLPASRSANAATQESNEANKPQVAVASGLTVSRVQVNRP